MATPVSSPPDSLSPEDRFLVEKAEEAIRDGLQLRRWCLSEVDRQKPFPLAPKRPAQLPGRAAGFFGSLEINGRASSVMGCWQEIELGSRIPATNPEPWLREYVLGQFLKQACWKNADGRSGGFTVEQGIFKTPGGGYGRLSAERAGGCMDWRDLGRDYAWVLLTLHIHDFAMNLGPFRKRLRVAACVVAHPGFVEITERPAPGIELDVTIGYPFVQFTPIPNLFGFGPGKFGVAVKLFSFRVTGEKQVRVRMTFAAAPRSEKVFDFGKRWPDPVFGGARLLERLTLRRWKSDWLHDLFDSEFLVMHCGVHQALLEGVAKLWK